jgi:hypothetical protein
MAIFFMGRRRSAIQRSTFNVQRSTSNIQPISAHGVAADLRAAAFESTLVESPNTRQAGETKNPFILIWNSGTHGTDRQLVPSFLIPAFSSAGSIPWQILGQAIPRIGFSLSS